MIRNTIKLAAIATASLTFAGQALAQTQATGSATTTIQEAPVSVTKTADLAFGTIIKPTSGTSTITLNAATDSCTVVAISGGNATKTGTPACAVFTITGENAKVVAVTFVNASVTMTGSTGATPLTLALNKSANPTIASNTALVKVGGSFDVSTATVPTVYTGTIGVNVAYN